MATRTDGDGTAVRVGAYLIGLVIVFGAAFGIGRLVGPESEPTPPPQHSNQPQHSNHLGAANIGGGEH